MGLSKYSPAGPSAVRAPRAMGMHAPLTAVLASLPLMLFAGVVVYALWQQQQHQFEIQQRATARAIHPGVEARSYRR